MYVYHGYLSSLKAFTQNPQSSIVKIHQGTQLYFVLAKDKELIKEVLIKKYKPFSKGEKLMEPLALFGHNILTADSTNSIWKKHRTLANPIFSNTSHLRNVFRVTMEELPNMIKYWTNHYENKDGNINNVNITQELK